MKLLVPLKISTALPKSEVEIAPPSLRCPFAELLMKLLVPLRVSATLDFAPPLQFAELLLKALVPMNVSKVLVPA